MRQIKFRCWNAHSKIMHSWNELVKKNKIHLLANQQASYPVMQYTGMKDKNNVEIYEGDIVASWDYQDGYQTLIAEVKFSESGKFVVQDLNSSEIADLSEYNFDVEVIGNSYQSSLTDLVNG